jgi:hypothetical protein
MGWGAPSGPPGWYFVGVVLPCADSQGSTHFLNFLFLCFSCPLLLLQIWKLGECWRFFNIDKVTKTRDCGGEKLHHGPPGWCQVGVVVLLCASAFLAIKNSSFSNFLHLFVLSQLYASLCCFFKGSGEVLPRPGIVEVRIFTTDFLTGVMSVVFSFCANISIMKNHKFLELIFLALFAPTFMETLEGGRALAVWPRRSQGPWRCENFPRASSVEVSCVLVRCAGLVIHDVCVSRTAFPCCFWKFY